MDKQWTQDDERQYQRLTERREAATAVRERLILDVATMVWFDMKANGPRQLTGLPDSDIIAALGHALKNYPGGLRDALESFDDGVRCAAPEEDPVPKTIDEAFAKGAADYKKPMRPSRLG